LNELFDILNDPRQEAKWVRKLLDLSLLGVDRDGEPSLAALSQGLMKLANAAAAIERKCTGKASIREVLEMRPSFWFIGHDLAEIFETHFKLKATRTRADSGEPIGPFVRFATAVTTRFGEPLVDETVAKAISVVRKIERIAV